jgi:hypothetical protein
VIDVDEAGAVRRKRERQEKAEREWAANKQRQKNAVRNAIKELTPKPLEPAPVDFLAEILSAQVPPLAPTQFAPPQVEDEQIVIDMLQQHHDRMANETLNGLLQLYELIYNLEHKQ